MPQSFKDLSRDEVEHAMALHGDSIVIDSSLVAFINSIGEDIWIDDLLSGGVTAGNTTVCMGRSFSSALSELNSYHSWAKRKSDKALIVGKGSDIEKAKREGKHGVIFGPQDSSFLEGSSQFLKIAHEWGIRIIQLTYNFRNAAGDGCMERGNAGLSNYGVRLVEEMNELGILVDLSHTGDATCMETVELSKDPVSFTHVIPRSSTPTEMGGYAEWSSRHGAYGAFVDYSLARGVPDDILQACVEKGGVIGVTPFFSKKAGSSTLTDDLMDQIDYTVDLVGVDHVGFGSDLEYPNSITRGAYIWKYPERIDVDYHTPLDKDWGYGWLENMPNFTKGLVARGYSDQEAKKILGLNWVKLFKRVWGE